MSLSLFAEQNPVGISIAAAEQVKGYERLLAIRISLQKLLDDANKCPCRDSSIQANEKAIIERQDYVNLSDNVHTCLRNLVGLLNRQVSENENDGINNNRKKCRSFSIGDNEMLDWVNVESPQKLLFPKWTETINKWHARLHYGSEKTQTNMKVFNQKIMEQIDVSLVDQKRCLEKSRLPLNESNRVDKPIIDSKTKDFEGKEDNHDSDDGNEFEYDYESDSENARFKNISNCNNSLKRKLDLEVYDDRAFYSMLLKTYITSNSSGVGGMRADDLATLRRYKKNKEMIDRKASKGRKLRYTVHKKLQNFMFPHEAPEPSVDCDALLQSLFQS